MTPETERLILALFLIGLTVTLCNPEFTIVVQLPRG